MILNKTRDRHLQENCVYSQILDLKFLSPFETMEMLWVMATEFYLSFASPFEMTDMLLVMATENLLE